MRRLPALAALLSAAAALGQPAGGDEAPASMGPLHAPSSSPLQALRMTLAPRGARALPRGRTEVTGVAVLANIWGLVRHEEVLLDYETLSPSLAIAHGVTDRLQVEVALESRARFGGILDPIADGLHRILNRDPHGRDEVPRGGVLAQLGPDRGRRVLDGDDGGFFRHAVLGTLQYEALRGEGWRPSVVLGTTASVALHTEVRDGIPVDAGAWAAASKDLGPVTLHVMAGGSWFGRDDFRGVPLRRSMATIMGAGEWRLAPGRSLVLQYHVQQGAASDLGLLSSSCHEIFVGYRHRLAGGTELEVALLENLVTFDNSPDFGIHAGFSRRF